MDRFGALTPHILFLTFAFGALALGRRLQRGKASDVAARTDRILKRVTLFVILFNLLFLVFPMKALTTDIWRTHRWETLQANVESWQRFCTYARKDDSGHASARLGWDCAARDVAQGLLHSGYHVDKIENFLIVSFPNGQGATDTAPVKVWDLGVLAGGATQVAVLHPAGDFRALTLQKTIESQFAQAWPLAVVFGVLLVFGISIFLARGPALASSPVAAPSLAAKRARRENLFPPWLRLAIAGGQFLIALWKLKSFALAAFASVVLLMFWNSADGVLMRAEELCQFRSPAGSALKFQEIICDDVGLRAQLLQQGWRDNGFVLRDTFSFVDRHGQAQTADIVHPKPMMQDYRIGQHVGLRYSPFGSGKAELTSLLERTVRDSTIAIASVLAVMLLVMLFVLWRISKASPKPPVAGAGAA